MRTPEQISADNGLQEAITAVLYAYDLLSDDEFLMDFAVPYCVLSHADEEIEKYGTLHPNGQTNRHRVIGLLRYAESQQLRNFEEVE